jgi:cystathionine beta-lyase/cystathionine gamma-synthase
VPRTRRNRRPPYIVRPDTAILTRGFDPRLSVGSARPAVFRSSTYVFRTPESAERAFAVALGRAEPEPGEDVDLIYSRLSHPNAEILEDQILPLEPGAAAAAVFNTGLAALATAFLAFLRPGSSLVYTEPVYGGTHHLIRELLVPFGVEAIPVPAGDADAMAGAIRGAKDLRFVLIETPANPTLVMTDVAAAVRAAGRRDDPPWVAVDNTFLGPVFQHPLALGADLSIYSATKYLSGGSDLLGGVILGSDPEPIRTLRGVRAMLGTILQPDECWLLDSRLPTVRLRMNRQSKSAARIVEGLKDHPRIERLHYPTCFRDRSQRRIYESQCAFPGAIFSMEIAGGKKAAFDFLRGLHILHDAVSLGGVESLACHPASTTHSEMDPDALARSGVTPGLVRISVGVEDWRDLLRDVRGALDGIP